MDPLLQDVQLKKSLQIAEFSFDPNKTWQKLWNANNIFVFRAKKGICIILFYLNHALSTNSVSSPQQSVTQPSEGALVGPEKKLFVTIRAGEDLLEYSQGAQPFACLHIVFSYTWWKHLRCYVGIWFFVQFAHCFCHI